MIKYIYICISERLASPALGKPTKTLCWDQVLVHPMKAVSDNSDISMCNVFKW